VTGADFDRAEAGRRIKELITNLGRTVAAEVMRTSESTIKRWMLLPDDEVTSLIGLDQAYWLCTVKHLPVEYLISGDDSERQYAFDLDLVIPYIEILESAYASANQPVKLSAALPLCVFQALQDASDGHHKTNQSRKKALDIWHTMCGRIVQLSSG